MPDPNEMGAEGPAVVEPETPPQEPEEQPGEEQVLEPAPLKPPEESPYLVDEGDVRFKDTATVVESTREARRTIAKVIREKRVEVAEKERLRAENEALKVQLGVKPRPEAPHVPKPSGDFKAKIETLPNPNEDFDGYVAGTKAVISELADVVENMRSAASPTAQREMLHRELELRDQERQKRDDEDKEAADAEAVCREHPELYIRPDISAEEAEIILHDSTNPEHVQLKNALELLRLSKIMPAKRAHTLIAAERGVSAPATPSGKEQPKTQPKPTPKPPDVVEYERQRATRTAVLRAPSDGGNPPANPENLTLDQQLSRAKDDFVRAK